MEIRPLTERLCQGRDRSLGGEAKSSVRFTRPGMKHLLEMPGGFALRPAANYHEPAHPGSLQNILNPDRHLADPDPRGVIHRVGDGRRDPDHRQFSNSLYTELEVEQDLVLPEYQIFLGLL